MVINFGFFAPRLVPARLIPPRLLLPLLTVAVGAAAALIAVADTGTSTLFAFFLAAYIGYRLDIRPATFLAVALSVACGISWSSAPRRAGTDCLSGDTPPARRPPDPCRPRFRAGVQLGRSLATRRPPRRIARIGPGYGGDMAATRSQP